MAARTASAMAWGRTTRKTTSGKYPRSTAIPTTPTVLVNEPSRPATTEARSTLVLRRETNTSHDTIPIGMRGRIETRGFLRGGTTGSNQEKMPKISPARAPTTGPSRAPPTMAGMCNMVARPETFGTGIKPSWVAPRKIAIPPSIPAITICLTSSLKIEPPRLPPEPAVMIFSFCRLPGPAILYTGRSICVRNVEPLQRRLKASVCGGPATIDQHEGARDVGAGFRGEVEDHADHLVRHGPAAEDALGGVGVVPVRGVLDLGRQRRLDDSRRYSVDSDTAGSYFGSKGPQHLHRPCFRRGVDSLSRFDHLSPDAREGYDAA